MFKIRSKTEQKLLTYYFLNTNARHHLHELARILNVDPANLSKKLKKMEKAKLFKSENLGNLKIYSLNHKFPLFSEYKSIINKTFGVEDMLKKALSNIPGIQKAYIFGSYANGKFDEYSDIDLLVIGNHNGLELSKALVKIEGKINREINHVEIYPSELKKRLRNNQFFKNIFEHIIQFI